MPDVASFECTAPEGAYCRFGCEGDPCAEVGWEPMGFLRLWCSLGHILTDHACWVQPWVEMTPTEDNFDGVDHSVPIPDGEIEIVEWNCDEFVYDVAAS